ncbi:MAG: DUF1679 domain-containing protein [Phenylobacterium sp.]|uniref:phosphotransferase n=1 Tax=Phenylobacterium sp. TaxID=1871053 RepID=UPI00121CB526|nr:phosphotransferase [Phenylobacterium sp.]TAJ74328.1 MAG: DUF1679 domain-containing protein [Phenylobacterium sp.]
MSEAFASIGKTGEQEMIAGSVSTTPWAPDALSCAWLQAVLQDAGALGVGDEVLTFQTSPLGEGVGLLGALVRIGVVCRASGGEAPRTLVAKFSTSNAENRAVAMAFGVYAREVGFYRHVAPHLPGIAPRCFAAEYDAASGGSVLILEDLAAYRMGDQVAGCAAREVEDVIELLIPMHVRHWGRVDDPGLAWAPRIDGPMQLEGFAQGCAAGWEPCVSRFGHVIGQDILSRRDQFVAAVPELSRRMGAAPQTLVHGDLRLDNLMFGQAPGQRPAVAIDWIVTFSAAIHDLAYLLTQNLRTDERRRHERRLVARYQQRLREQGIADYSAEQAWEDYLVAALYLFSYGVVIAGALDPGNARAALMMEQLMARASAVIMDHQLLDRLPG